MKQPSVYSLPQAPHLIIACVEAGPVATNGYIVADTNAGQAIIIDAPHQSYPVYRIIMEHLKVQPTALWLTHSHWDHTADAAQIAADGLEIWIHEADLHRLTDPMSHTIWPLPFHIEPVQTNLFLQDKQQLHCGDWTFTVLHTPGHTQGGVCFICQEYDCAFVGDTIFAGSIGRTDLPGGDMNQLIESIHQQLMNLNEDTVIFPGHGELSTIGQEKEDNPFLNGNNIPL
jgi:glyoxylase-like metal-dependent hydrolase (beta-lactamase superfamily II)